MAYLTFADVRQALRSQYPRAAMSKEATRRLLRESARVRPGESFDIFLSHSIRDAELIAGVKAYLEEHGLTVYVDWIDDPQMDRTQVTAQTAHNLRTRMRSSAAMIFATSEASPSSKWMPWELGYFDGLRSGRVAILPLVPTATSGFRGQEYLGLYPTLEKLKATGGQMKPFITQGAGSRRYMSMTDFKQGATSFRSYR